MLARAACQNHIDREAIGICIKCRARICSECVTQIEGVNHCVSCFGTAGAKQQATPQSASFALSVALASVSAVVLVAVVWIVLEVAFPGG